MTEPKLLALPGFAFPQVDFFTPTATTGFDMGGHIVRLAKPAPIQTETFGEDPEDHSVQTGRTVWDCSIILAKYLEFQVECGGISLTNKYIVELGAGAGLTGICAALLAKGTSEVVLTDVAVHVPSSIKLNFSSSSDSPAQCSARALDWLAPLPVDLRKPVDVILAADVVWLTDLIEPLVNTLCGLASETTVILLAYQSRSKRADHLLFAALQPSFTCEPISVDGQHPVFRNPEKVYLYKLTKIRVG